MASQHMFRDPGGEKTYGLICTAAQGSYTIFSGEVGQLLAIDFSNGDIHSYIYGSFGVGLGFGGSVNIEVGTADMNCPLDITRHGLSFSAFAAAGKGVSFQYSGTGPFGNGSSLAGGGFAAGAGAGVSGSYSYTKYTGKKNYNDLPDKIQNIIKSSFGNIPGI